MKLLIIVLSTLFFVGCKAESTPPTSVPAAPLLVASAPILPALPASVAGAPADPTVVYKTVCLDTTDRAGNVVNRCTTVRVRQRYEGTVIPPKKQ